MRIHYNCHHRAYVDALNAVEARLEVARESGDFRLIRYLQQLIASYASDHFLHSIFWEVMGPNQGGQPRDDLADQIAEDFGSFAAFKSQFSLTATSLDGSGWVILAWQPGGQRLALLAAESHQLQPERAVAAVLVLDMCEHAYYLKYQHRRAEYAHNWWNTVNWARVAQRFAAATHAWSGIAGSASAPRGPRLRRRHRYVSPTISDGVAGSVPGVELPWRAR